MKSEIEANNLPAPTGVLLHPVVRRFVVSGHAFVPVKVRIEIEAADADAAMKAANKKLKTKIRNHIVAGSDDEGAAWGFDATDAEEIKSPKDQAEARGTATSENQKSL